VQDWDEESYEDEAVEEEVELIRVQQEIERLSQEQESIMRRYCKQQLSVPKLKDSTSIECEQGLWRYHTPSISFASMNRGKSLHSNKCSIPSMPTIHLRHTTTSLIISCHHLCHIITFLTTTHHHLHHKIN
jgi:hypothetical protein